jgi:hypothetical protein
MSNGPIDAAGDLSGDTSGDAGAEHLGMYGPSAAEIEAMADQRLRETEAPGDRDDAALRTVPPPGREPPQQEPPGPLGWRRVVDVQSAGPDYDEDEPG